MTVLSKPELEAKLKDEHSLIRSGVLREENPLDLSHEFAEFMEACRRGDLKTCQELISAGVNINGKDTFDYTPLIVASLCGHFDLVRFLLEAGALAERNTFQGERCIYNALNDKIRKLLLEYDYSKSTDPLQPWSSHITSLLSLPSPQTADICLAGPHGSFRLHKFLLAARTGYIRKKLGDAPETKTWKLTHSVPIESFAVVVKYLYLGELPRDFASGSTAASEEDIFKGIDKVSRSLEIEHLWDAVLSANDRRLARQRYQDEVQRAQAQVEGFFQDSVLKYKMVVDTHKVKDVKWPEDNAIFADCLIRADEVDGAGDGDGSDQQSTPRGPPSAGIPVGAEIEGRKEATNGTSTATSGRSAIYPAHKAMLIRSPYFQTMFSGPFLEAQKSEHLHIIKVDCSPEVLEVVLTFLYTEKADCPLNLALDLLYTADMLLLDKLKTKAAGIISALGSGNMAVDADGSKTQGVSGISFAEEAEPINVYDVIHAAWDLRVQRLEEFAARYIASRLEDYVDDPEFAELIRESAARIKNREETDTIELLDDIRYYLDERFRLRFEDAGWEEIMSGEEKAASAAVAATTAIDGADPEAIAAHEAVAADIEATQGSSSDGADEDTRPGDKDDAALISTLDGRLVEDEFEADAANYQILLGKIDDMLERLKLDA